MNTRTSRSAALLGAVALLGLSAAPAAAATPVAQASASAVVVTVGGTPEDSGTYRVTHDGNRETATGSNRPAIGPLAGQSALSASTLAQDATTTVRERRGSSTACAGLAGDGATLVAAGSGTCLSPGKNLALNAGNLDLSGLTISESTVLDGLDRELQDALQPALDEVLPALSQALQQVLSELGNPGVIVDIGAIQSTCTASTTGADGNAELADVAAYVQVGDQRVDLVSFPVHPAPNTKVVTNLDGVAEAVQEALRGQLATALDGALGPLGDAVDQAAVITNVLAELGAGLAPLEENLLEGTLNKQARPAKNAIEVTALDLSVVPAANEPAGLDVLRIQIAATTCGPNGRVAPPPARRATPRPPAPVPTSVPAGLATAGPEAAPAGDGSAMGGLALAALVGASAAAGVASYRRSLRG